MAWAFEFGDQLEFLEKQHELNKHKPDWNVPRAIKERPELDMIEQVYVTDFYRLGSSRQIGMSVGPIPVSEITDYWEKLGIDDMEEYLYVIQAADNTYMTKVAEKQKAESASKATGPNAVKGVRT